MDSNFENVKRNTVFLVWENFVLLTVLNDLESVFLNDKSDSKNSQTIFAKKGVFEDRKYKKVLVLYDGVTINNVNGKISKFTFDKTDFNISRFSSSTVTHQKIQETPTTELIKCILALNKMEINLTDNSEISKLSNCRPQSL